MIKEFCANNFDRVPEAIEMGINRIELCDRLDLGGTTPDPSVQRETVDFAHQRGVEVMCMIRPRGGSFVYSDDEKEEMINQAKTAIESGVDGLVFGCLTEEGELDKPILEDLIALAQTKDRQTVFHMAFDQIPHDKQREALKWLIEKGVTRLLTRGGTEGSALENKGHIEQVIRWADGKVEIMPGGGVTHETLSELEETLAVNQFHGSQIVPLERLD